MKVTTELKNLIKRSFDEKRVNITRELKEAANNLYEEKKNEVANSKEFKEYVKACNLLYERFKEDYNNQGSNRYDGKTPFRLYFDGIHNVKIDNVVGSNVDYYARNNNEIQTNVNKEIKALDLAQEALMIKLTYEKDLDKIREMLAEYDITI